MEEIKAISEKRISLEEEPWEMEAIRTAKTVKPDETAKIAETVKTSVQSNQEIRMPKDEYISSEQSEDSGQISIGIYSVEKDQNGKTVIKFDDPDKAQQQPDGNNSTIRRLKSTRDSLKMQIKQAADNPVKVEQLRKKLKKIEKEIRQALA